MNDKEKLELIGLRAFYNYFFDNLYSDGYEVLDAWGNPEGFLSDYIDAAYDAKGKAEVLALSETKTLTIHSEEEKEAELPAWAAWLARDEDGELWAYECKPVRRVTCWDQLDGEFEPIGYNSLYAEVKWTDDEPTRINRTE